METSELVTLLDNSPVADMRNRLLAAVRPAIDLVLHKPLRRDARSRLGGDPDRPRGAAWPTHALGLYQFLGQFDFEEVGSSGGLLPTSGLLVLFWAYDEGFESFWQDPGYLRAEFHPTTTTLARQPSPHEVANPNAIPIGFKPTVDLPFDAKQLPGWDPDLDTLNKYQDFRRRLGLSDNHLLGYPSHTSLGYDPTPGPSWRPLFTLESHDSLEWCWHDGDNLMAFIEQAALAKRDFSELKADAG